MTKIKQYTTHRLVRSEHLNHHGTLFAGFGAQWFVESGFVAASKLLPAKNLICLQLDSLHFKKSVKAGEIVCFNSRIVYAGKSSLVAYIKVNADMNEDECADSIVDGFAVFVYVDENTKPQPHNIQLEASSEEDLLLIEKWNLKREPKDKIRLFGSFNDAVVTKEADLQYPVNDELLARGLAFYNHYKQDAFIKGAIWMREELKKKI